MKLTGFISGDVYEAFYPVNLFFLPQAWSGQPGLVGTPGLKIWCDLAVDTPVRGMVVMGDYVYAATDTTVYRIDSGATATACTGALLTSSGPVQMVHNGTYVMLVDGTYGYYISGTTLTQITDTDFPTPVGLAYQDNYFFVVQKDSGRMWSSALNDPSDWDSTDYTSPGGSPDYTLQVVSDHRELIAFGEDSVEIFVNTANANGFPFTRREGSTMEIGLGASLSPAKIDNSVFFLANDWTVRRIADYVPKVISPPALSAMFAGFETKSDARAYTYRDRGNSFYVLSFPTENCTYVYNAATNLWHQWSSGDSGGRHRSECFCEFAGKNLVGDYDVGKIYELSADTYKDDGVTIVSTRTSPPVYDDDQRNLFWHRIQVVFKSGVGLATGQGSDPQAMMRYSDDGGRTWSNERWASFGAIGENTYRTIWRRCGKGRNRVVQVSISDPVERVMVSANAEIERGTA